MASIDGSVITVKTKKYVVFSVDEDNDPLFILCSEPRSNARIYLGANVSCAIIFEEEEKDAIPILMKKLFPEHSYNVSQL